MKKIYIAMAAALMLAACGKENDGVAEQGYDSFVISVADLGGAGNAKAHWGSANANGFYWDNGDKVLINGKEHAVHGSGTNTWTTTGPQVNPIDNGFFYVASYNGAVETRYVKDEGRSYGLVAFNGGIPLACKGKTNKLTLYPCCAVVRSTSYGHLDFLDANDEFGTVSGRVLRSGNIDIANVCLSGGEEIEYGSGIDVTDTVYTDENEYYYFIIPMEGKSVTAKLQFDWDKTTRAPVTIQQGYIYDVD